MAALQKFMFETRFDEAAASGKRPERRPPPKSVSMSEDDLAAVRAEAHAAGRAEAAAEAKDAAETLAAQSLARIGERLGELAPQMTSAVDAVKRDAVTAALTALRKLVPHLAKEGDLADLEAVVTNCLTAVLEEPRVVVRLHDSMLDPIKERIADIAAKAGYDGKVVLVADDHLGPGDCRVEWADGGAERDTGWMWTQIEGVVERFFAGLSVAPPERPAAQEPAPADSEPPDDTAAPTQ